jgi:hypothetical protein
MAAIQLTAQAMEEGELALAVGADAASAVAVLSATPAPEGVSSQALIRVPHELKPNRVKGAIMTNPEVKAVVANRVVRISQAITAGADGRQWLLGTGLRVEGCRAQHLTIVTNAEAAARHALLAAFSTAVLVSVHHCCSIVQLLSSQLQTHKAAAGVWHCYTHRLRCSNSKRHQAVHCARLLHQSSAGKASQPTQRSRNLEAAAAQMHKHYGSSWLVSLHPQHARLQASGTAAAAGCHILCRLASPHRQQT